MYRREFITTLGLGSFALAAGSRFPPLHSLLAGDRDDRRKYWTWVTTDVAPSADEWKMRFAAMRRAGIDAILPEIYNSQRAFYESRHLPVESAWLEEILPLAKAEGLEVHAWIWTMPCNIEEVRDRHPEWFCVNRKGESAAEKPAYVDDYRFLCPSQPEVHEFIKTTVTELCGYDALDGIHLDYVRYPDVILPEALQPKYGIKQDREYPQYDYCYCEVCRRDFEKETGIDVSKLDDPALSVPWKQFRYDRITHLVNDTVIPVAHKNKKLVTAAVFPNWDMVRQEWPAWKLDAALPMLYHSLYGEGIEWIREKTEKGVKSLAGRAPLYSGLLLFRMSPEELAKAIAASLEGGAKGVVLFPAQAMTEAHWKSFSEAIRK
jgi:uncharacterized lipoprotein YddW (UPF0748 family)